MHDKTFAKVEQEIAVDSVLGCLLGGAVGDAAGLPTERLSRKRIERLYGAVPVRHRFLFGRGMFSDDTEHTVMVALALLRHPRDPVAFQRALSWSLRWWLLAIPAAVGMATAKAILRLWVGVPVSKSGVHSAGNGPAMRSAIIGVALVDDQSAREEFARLSCRLTHTDQRAEEAASLVAEAASLAAKRCGTEIALERLQAMVHSAEMRAHFEHMERALRKGRSVSEFAKDIGCGERVSGFAPHSVAVAIFAWLRHRQDFPSVLSAVISCGGDTDTVAAIACGICGAEVGEQGIPAHLVLRICDWPLSVSFLRKVAASFTSRANPSELPRLLWPFLVLRNIVFLLVVLFHGVRRLFPPY
ncbi:MAG: ADP-ribosylglycohydrolase family protein [Verrucomicrobiales bacterium]